MTLQEQRAKCINEMKLIDEEAKTSNRSLTDDEQRRFDKLALEAQKLNLQIKEEERRLKAQGFTFSLPPLYDGEEGSGDKLARSVLNKDTFLAMAQEKRSLTLNGSGAVEQIQGLFKEQGNKDTILEKVRYYYGPNAMTDIPVVTALEEPSDYAEGAENVATDTASNLYITTLKAKAYSTVLPVTAEMLNLSFAGTRDELPELFRKTFSKVIHKGIIVGTGLNDKMKGLFTSAAANQAGITEISGSNITLGELAQFALSVGQKDDEYTIVMNLATYQHILADTTNGEDVKFYKECLIRDKSIEGVKVLLDPYAPSTTEAGDILAVAAPLSRYAVGIAGELQIDPIKEKGDTKTYFQATMFLSGKQVTDKDVYSLAIAAST